MTIASQLLARRKSADDDQLLRLFWNRAELKKEFAQLRRERDQLNDQLRQQESATLRAQQRLEQIEGLLADPYRAANVVVFYQLRGVWQHCRRRLARLANEISARQQEREQERAAARLAGHRAAAVESIDRRIEEITHRQEILAGDLQHLVGRRAALAGFWNLFRRRNLLAQEHAIKESLTSLDAQKARYLQAREQKLAALPEPEAALSVDGRRLVNLSVIALGQELLLHFQPHNIARLARDAAARKPVDVQYGDNDACRELGRRVEQSLKKLDALSELPARVRRRAEVLSREAHYRRDSDTVPVAGSFDLIVLEPGQPVGPEARSGALAANILAEEYWDIYSVLLV